jgi:hypothetical protein
MPGLSLIVQEKSSQVKCPSQLSPPVILTYHGAKLKCLYNIITGPVFKGQDKNRLK